MESFVFISHILQFSILHLFFSWKSLSWIMNYYEWLVLDSGTREPLTRTGTESFARNRNRKFENSIYPEPNRNRLNTWRLQMTHIWNLVYEKVGNITLSVFNTSIKKVPMIRQFYCWKWYLNNLNVWFCEICVLLILTWCPQKSWKQYPSLLLRKIKKSFQDSKF